ncbi:DUF6262 family protein [Streptomyces canus]|uniref:DUF6262 family protein n=1 Tax=Streptomyces canus TaxID=58343 RepID=UPI00325343EC|nr:DUF6262 family protein [Streptomyces canus]
MAEPRTPAQVLHEARQKDSRVKRARVLGVVDQMLAEKEPVSFTAVARTAKVSHWLVYAEGVREVIEQARRRQARQPREDGGRKAPAGWQVEVQITREDNRRLREEVDRLKAAVRRSLGQQIDQVGAADLGARVDELTAANQRLEGELAQEKARAEELQGRLTEAEDDLAGARTSLRRMIRSGNQEPAV